MLRLAAAQQAHMAIIIYTILYLYYIIVRVYTTIFIEPALTPGMGRTDSNGVSPPGRHLEQLDKAEI